MAAHADLGELFIELDTGTTGLQRLDDRFLVSTQAGRYTQPRDYYSTHLFQP